MHITRRPVEEHMFHSLSKRIYHSQLYSLLDGIGAGEKIADLYWRIQFAIHDDVVNRTVGDTSSQFHIKTRSEYTRFRDPTFKGEIEVLENMMYSLNGDNVFYDIGANVGLHACFASNIIHTGSVVAIEPHATSVQRLRENLELNNNNAIIREVGFSSKNQSANLVLPVDQAGTVGDVQSKSSGGNKEHIEIKLVRGDDEVINGNLPNPTVLKIDVDGGEYDVLTGLRQTIESGGCRTIFCEIHPEPLQEYGSSESEVLSLLREWKYSIQELEIPHGSRTDEYYIRADR